MSGYTETVKKGRAGDAMNTILIIDDDMDLCELLRDYLTTEGFAVETVYDGVGGDRKSTRLNSSHSAKSRMPSSA